ncbi:hypothetical protein ERUR111494_01750 [Erysipelothrix urinaevulpis]|uniref:hypothetical protein n=1 Tax=Erysipelothrix urinaevulpis TaxID=2683717 RepID=UPI0013593823|nr:hypothetical protein [Erysipelothrix urinaevulpis]
MELVMPMNYELLKQEEMMYLDGGWSAYTVAKNLTNLAAMGIAGAMLASVGKIMWNAARKGISFTESVAKIAVGVSVGGTVWALGTWTF